MDQVHQSRGFSSPELIVYPLLFGGGSIIIIYLLKKYLLQEDISDFNSGEGCWQSDLGWGLALTLAYFILFFLARAFLMDVLEFRPNLELLGAMLELRENPLLLLLWFGPVLWIGVAMYEELVRVFLLTGLWKFSNSVVWVSFVIVLASVLMGLVHWSQGSYGVVTIAMKSLISGYFFYKKRRLMPLVYAHVLYDGLQVATLLLTYPEQ